MPGALRGTGGGTCTLAGQMVKPLKEGGASILEMPKEYDLSTLMVEENPDPEE